METFTKLHNDFCDNDDLTTRVATMDAVAEAEATPDCPRCNGEGYVGTGLLTFTVDGPMDDTDRCDYCGGTGKMPETVSRAMACPDCGENRQDWLTCDPEDCEHITCENCHNDYYLDEMTDAEQRRESR